MRGLRTGLVVGLVAVAVVASARLSLRAQDQPKPAESKDAVVEKPAVAPVGDPAAPARAPDAPVSIQDALERPLILPFGTPTRLDEVCAHLRRVLNAPIVLDRAALDRQDVRPDDTIELELHGVRLKTGLKLLLDQVGLTYRVVPEDNLLIVTDRQGADDPLNRIFAELEALHRDLHDVQDAVDELKAAMGLGDEGPKMRKPTIIEELPEQPAEKKAPSASPPPRSRSGI
jgi:hypothetical protein